MAKKSFFLAAAFLAAFILLSVSSYASSPGISDVNATLVNDTSATITWATNENANSSVNYGNTTALGNVTSSPEMVMNHSINLTSLTANTTYYYNVTSCDSSGNCNTSGIFNFTTLPPDITPPSISDVNATNITNSSAVITWTTNESSNSSVSYGINISLGNINSSSEMTISHSIDLTSLTSNKTYYYNVTSCDSSGNCNTSDAYNFTTLDIIIEMEMNWSEWYTNGTINFSQYSTNELENISNVTFTNQYGAIAYLEPLNITASRNLTGNIVVANLSITVNSTSLPEFNRSAKLTFSGVPLAHPVVKREGSDCGSYCQNASYNSTTGIYNVTVLSFSSTSGTEPNTPSL